MMHDAIEKDSLDDTLAHYGVKGMKWGVRREKKPASTSDTTSRGNPTSGAIKLARKNTLARREEERKNASTRRAKADIAINGEFAKSLSREYRANPERAIAFNMTRGERIANTLIAAGSLGLSLPVTGANLAITSAVRRDQRRAAAGD